MSQAALDALNRVRARESVQTIELDCAPGCMRPSDLIVQVVEGTVLEALTVPTAPRSTFFGNWTWEYPSVTAEQWREAQAITRPRIERLYRQGYIRYGSW